MICGLTIENSDIYLLNFFFVYKVFVLRIGFKYLKSICIGFMGNNYIKYSMKNNNMFFLGIRIFVFNKEFIFSRSIISNVL